MQTDGAAAATDRKLGPSRMNRTSIGNSKCRAIIAYNRTAQIMAALLNNPNGKQANLKNFSFSQTLWQKTHAEDNE